MKKLSILKNRKLRCGGFSALLTALALVFAVLLGALADTAETRYALTLDCSFNAATTQGETTRAVLAQLERDVHIYALVSETEGKNATLFSLLERYAAASPHVTYSQESAVRNPVLLSQFSDALGENDVTGDCLIVSCPETGRARVLNEIMMCIPTTAIRDISIRRGISTKKALPRRFCMYPRTSCPWCRF